MFMAGSENLLTLQKYLWITCGLLWLYWLWTRRHFYMFAFKQPGFWGFPILGCVNKVTRIEDGVQFLGVLFKETKRPFAMFWLGMRPVFGVKDPNLTEKVLKSRTCFEKSEFFYGTLRHGLFDGLITMRGEKWIKHRKLLNPTFHQGILLSFFEIFNQEADSIVKAMKKLSRDKVEIGSYEAIRKSALNSVIKTTMGQKVENYEELYMRISNNIDKLLEVGLIYMYFSAFHLSWLIYLNIRFENSRRSLGNYVQNIIKQRFDSQTTTNIETDLKDDDDAIFIKKQPRVFIDELVHLILKKQMAFDEVSNHGNHIIAGGFETVTVAVLGVLLLLATHPEEQERLFEEIVRVAPDKEAEISGDEFKELPYLDMVIDESLRLIPTVPLISRECTEATKLTDEITVPKGMSIVIDVFHLHRNKSVWGEDAEEFRPERFSPENSKGRHPYGFIPFSKASRDCIGQRYAYFFMRICLIRILRNFRFASDFKMKDLKLHFHIHSSFPSEPKLRIEERN